MNPNLTTVAAWSYGLAGFGYGALALYLASGPRGGLRGLSLLVAVGLTVAWAMLNCAYVLAPASALLTLGAAVDVLRVGSWYAFLLLLIERPRVGADPANPSRVTWLAPVAGALVTLGLVAQSATAAGLTRFGSPARLALFDNLALSVVGLVLVEQLFRNLPKDARWSMKPLCLGLAGAMVFDLYLFADALLFSRVDADAWSVRGLVHALVIPFLAVSMVRIRDWRFGIALSRRVVFHSTALLATGVYLLFVAAAGYYVRYFGGQWGGALQIALVFAALLVLGAMALSGSLRAKLRVIVSKHFFTYRYDYRDEWLRFTQALSARGGQSELGQDVVKGLADMLESPGGSLWLRDAPGHHFTQAARWNAPAEAGMEPADSAFVRFLIDKGWVVNLEEFRASPERYRELELPLWLSESPNAWLIIPLANGN